MGTASFRFASSSAIFVISGRLYTFSAMATGRISPNPGCRASGLASISWCSRCSLHSGLLHKPAVAAAIRRLMLWNFALNRRFASPYARGSIDPAAILRVRPPPAPWAPWSNYVTTTKLGRLLPTSNGGEHGVLAGTLFNFGASPIPGISHPACQEITPFRGTLTG